MTCRRWKLTPRDETPASRGDAWYDGALVRKRTAVTGSTDANSSSAAPGTRGKRIRVGGAGGETGAAPSGVRRSGHALGPASRSRARRSHQHLLHLCRPGARAEMADAAAECAYVQFRARRCHHGFCAGQRPDDARPRAGWYHDIPDWTKQIKDTRGVERAYVDHIGTVVSYYKDKLTSWDVVNEPILTIPAVRRTGATRSGPSISARAGFRWPSARRLQPIPSSSSRSTNMTSSLPRTPSLPSARLIVT